VDIFNNRELAITLWLIAISIYIFLSPKMIEVRASVIHLLSVFFVTKIITILGLMITYMAVLVYGLSEIDLWNEEQLKNTIFWCASVGFMSLFKIQSIKKDKSFFTHSLVDNLKLLVILQFIIGVYSFSLWIEVLIVPLLVLFGGMLAISETDKKYHQVKVLVEYSLSLFGMILISYTLYMLVTNFGEFGKEKTIYDFFIPPLLTLLYLPFIFAMMVYSTYEDVFIRINLSINNKFHRYLAKLYSIVLFNVRMSLLERWSIQLARNNIDSHTDLIETLKYIFKVRSSEKRTKEVPILLGWSPYEAKVFLSSIELDTGFYDRMYEEEWFASSPLIEFGDGFIRDNAAYYVEGSEEVATTLKIKINVNDSSRFEIAQEKIGLLAEVLSLSSLNQGLSNKMKKAILKSEDISEKCGNKSISLVVEKWPNDMFNGYSIKFIISSI